MALDRDEPVERNKDTVHRHDEEVEVDDGGILNCAGIRSGKLDHGQLEIIQKQLDIGTEYGLVYSSYILPIRGEV